MRGLQRADDGRVDHRAKVDRLAGADVGAVLPAGPPAHVLAFRRTRDLVGPPVAAHAGGLVGGVAPAAGASGHRPPPLPGPARTEICETQIMKLAPGLTRDLSIPSW